MQKTLDKLFEYEINTAAVPFLCCIVHRGGTEIYRFCGGAEYDEKRSLCFMYSLSKVFLSAAVMHAAEKGLFSLSDPAYKFLPELYGVKVKKRNVDGLLKIEPAQKPILISQLLTMTAGFDYNAQSPSIRKYIKETGGKFETRSISRALSEQPLLFEPGERFYYSLCHDVLAALLEEASGMSFCDYLSKYFLVPLGIKNAYFKFSEELCPRMATQYILNTRTGDFSAEPHNAFYLGSEYQSGGAGLIADADSVITFADMLACGGRAGSGERILKPETIDMMRRNRLTPRQMRDFYAQEPFFGYGYGYGVRTLINPEAAGTNAPCGTFGWSGAAGSDISIDPEHEITVFYTHHLLSSALNVHKTVKNIVYGYLMQKS